MTNLNLTVLKKIVESRNLITVDDLAVYLNLDIQTAKSAVKALWKKGLIMQTNDSWLATLFPKLRQPLALNPSDQAALISTAKGFFKIHPVIQSR